MLLRQHGERLDQFVRHLRELLVLAIAWRAEEDIARLTEAMEDFYRSDTTLLVIERASAEHECVPRTIGGPDHCGLCGDPYPEEAEQ